MLVNPHSFRMALRGRRDRLTAIARKHSVPVEDISTPAQMRRAVEQALSSNAELLVISGGDGTLQAIVSILADITTPEQRPRILVLGGGRTNYTARDLGSHSRLTKLLETALDQPQQLAESTRHSLVLRQPGQPDRHGFFVAASLVDFVIRDCHRYRSGGTGFLRRGHLSSAWRVTQLGLKSLVSRTGFQSPDLSIDAGALGQISGPVRLLVLTSLHHRDERIDPYAGRGDGAVRLAAIRGDATAFWRRLPRLVSGRYTAEMSPEQGFLSGRTGSVRVRGLTQVCLDGQEHDYDPDQILEIATGSPFRFLHR